MNQLPYELKFQIFETINDVVDLINLSRTSRKFYEVLNDSVNRDAMVAALLYKSKSINHAFDYSINKRYIEGIKKYGDVDIEHKNCALSFSSKNGYLDVFKCLIEIGANDVHKKSLDNCLRYDHLEILNCILESELHSLYIIIMYISYHGDEKFLKYLLDNYYNVGVWDFNEYLNIGITFGHQDFSIYIMENIVGINYLLAIQLSTKFNRTRILKYILTTSNISELTDDIIDEINTGIRLNHNDIVMLLIEYLEIKLSFIRMKTILNSSIVFSIECDRVVIARSLISYPHCFIDDIGRLYRLCGHFGRLDILKYLLLKYPDIFNKQAMLLTSAINGHFHMFSYIIAYCIETKYNIIDLDIDRYLQLGARDGHYNIVQYILETILVVYPEIIIDFDKAVQLAEENNHFDIAYYIEIIRSFYNR
jgi:hypothetical protein